MDRLVQPSKIKIDQMDWFYLDDELSYTTLNFFLQGKFIDGFFDWNIRIVNDWNETIDIFS